MGFNWRKPPFINRSRSLNRATGSERVYGGSERTASIRSLHRASASGSRTGVRGGGGGFLRWRRGGVLVLFQLAILWVPHV